MHAHQPTRHPTSAVIASAVAAVAALLALVATGPGATPAGAAGGAYVVDDVLDLPDAGPGDGACRTLLGTCTLRAALEESAFDAGPSHVGFAIPGEGPHTILTAASLPNVSDRAGPTVIDGYTQPGSLPNTADEGDDAVLRVQVMGLGPAHHDGIVVTSPGNVVRGLALFALRAKVVLLGPETSGNLVTGNFLGTDAAGAFVEPHHVDDAAGVVVAGGARDNQIGGRFPAERNVISGNAGKGVTTTSDGTDGNVVRRNLVGLSPAGEPMPNRHHGIDLNLGSSENVVRGNVVSSNWGSGIEVSHSRATVDNRILRNRVGTDLGGTTTSRDLANLNGDVRIEDGPTRTLIADNVIGGSGVGGVLLDPRSFGTVVEGNRIGLPSTGAPVHDNIAVRVETEGGARIGPWNVITASTTGIEVTGQTTTGVTITRNAVAGNAGLGIDLDPVGIANANDPGDADTGANGLLNTPEVDELVAGFVAGSTCPRCLVEVFLADDAGQGAIILGVDRAGPLGRFELFVLPSDDDRRITTTATAPDGSTSEFSPAAVLPAR